MITVYESKETNFRHNGLGVLRPSSCLIYEELNGEYSLTLKHPIDNYEKWKLLEQDRIIKANGQLFRIYKLTHSVMDNEVEVFAMHIFYDLSKNFIKDINIVDKTGKQALNHILNNTLYESDFTCDSDITKINSARLVRKNVTSVLIGDDENSFLNYWGGELKRDNFNFQINTVIGKNKGMKISYGKNLTGLTATFDMSNIVTRIVPVAFDGITLPEVYVDSDYVNNYAQPIVREVEFSDVKFASSPNNTSEEGFATREEVYAELRRLSRLMFTNDKIDVPEINFNVDFVELSKTEQYKKYSNLETVELGDVVNIHHKVLGINIDARVISYEFNCLTNRYDSIELGSFQTNIFTGINELIKREDINMQTITDLVNVSYENAVNEATLLITNGLGGYVVKTRDELLIMDSDDINTAKNVWRWNINGLGFSSTGYNGTYGLAMTHDGQIVANRITAGELNGEIIRANSISTNHLQVEAARKIESSQSEEEVRTLIEATLGSFEVTITDKYEAKIDDELNSFSNNYYTKVETESKIQQNASSITSTVNANYTTLNNKFNNYPTTTQMNSAIQQKADSITSTVNVNYTTLNDKFNNYSTTTQMNSAIQQKANEINLGVTQTINSIQTGGKNLIKNGNFEDGLNHWVYERFSGIESSSIEVWTGNHDDYRDEWCMDGKKHCTLYVQSIDDSNRRGEWTVRQSFPTVIGQEYTVSYMIAGHRSNKTVAVMENINWDHLGTKYYGDLTGGKNANGWVYDSITFTATTSESMIWFIMSEVIYGTDGHLWFTDVCCVEGNKAQRFIPSLEEYSTTAQMDSAIQLKTDSITSTVNANYTTLNNKFNDYPTTTQMNSAIQQNADSITSTVNTNYATLNDKFNDYPTTTQMNSVIQQNADSITSTINTNYTTLNDKFNNYSTTAQMNSAIQQKADSITSTINTNYSTLNDKFNDYSTTSQMNSAITQKADSITSSVSETYATKSTTNGLSSRLSTAESTISQHTNQIATKVDVNGVKSTIQQNPESVRIGFNGISDYFDLNSTRLQVGHADGSYTQIGQDGVTYYANGSGNRYHNLMKQGWVDTITMSDFGANGWSTTITLPSEFKGKVFSVIPCLTYVSCPNLADAIKSFEINIPQANVDYNKGTFKIFLYASGLWGEGLTIHHNVQIRMTWIAIA